MKCMLCGTDNREEAQRCKGCGALLSSAHRAPVGRTPAPTVLEGSSSPHVAANPGLSPADPAQAGGVQPATRRTRLASSDELSGSSAPARGVAPASPAASSGAQVNGPASASASRKTVYVPPDADEGTAASSASSSAHPAASGAQPRLFGFLVTYTWNPAGQWFPLREGKNVAGSEAGLDASLSADRAMSGKHFAILYRRGEIRVRDLDSTNATVVDGEEVWGDSIEAGHGSVIKAGDTTFQVIIVPPLTGVK